MLRRANTDKLSNMQSMQPSRCWLSAGLDCWFLLRLQRKWSAWSGRCTMTMIFLQDWCTLFPLAISQSRRWRSRVMWIISATWFTVVKPHLRSRIHRQCYLPTATSTFWSRLCKSVLPSCNISWSYSMPCSETNTAWWRRLPRSMTSSCNANRSWSGPIHGTNNIVASCLCSSITRPSHVAVTYYGSLLY